MTSAIVRWFFSTVYPPTEPVIVTREYRIISNVASGQSPVSPVWIVQRRTVYHYAYHTNGLAQRLWSWAFRDQELPYTCDDYEDLATYDNEGAARAYMYRHSATDFHDRRIPWYVVATHNSFLQKPMGE